jgi:nucleoside 2-deoxyribosyltransferase
MNLMNQHGLLKAYIAGPIFTPHQIEVHRFMVNEAIAMNYRVFSPYYASSEIWRGRKPKDCSREERLTVRNQNIENLRDADVLVSWINGRFEDGRCDTGVSWEMGYSYAVCEYSHGVNPLQIGYLHPWDAMPKDLNLMLAETLDALVTDPMSLRDALMVLIKGTYADEEMQPYEVIRERYDPSRLDLGETQPMIFPGGGLSSAPEEARDSTPRFSAEASRNDADYGASDPH